MFEPLLFADPSFGPAWRNFLSQWKEERDLPHYLALSDLAHHLIAQLEQGRTDTFEDVFGVVERWLVEGDEYVREAATLGLLEGIQNTLGGQDRQYRSTMGASAADFEPWLRPMTRWAWENLYRTWDGEPGLPQPPV